MIEKEIIDFYRSQIEDSFVPYWLHFIDKEYGGILNCITNDGERLISEDKFTWSQGRWLYIVSLLIKMKSSFPSLDWDLLEESAEKTASFIIDHAFSPSLWAAFRMDRKGEWKTEEGETPFSSIYADCFAVIGLSEYASLKKDGVTAKKVRKIMLSILERIESGKYHTEPYLIPEGYISHGIPMILSNTLETVCQMEESLSLSPELWRSKERQFVESTISQCLDEERGLVHEYVGKRRDYRRLLDRHINPGHTLEDAWFWIECFEREGILEEKLPLISKVVKNTSALGWDEKEGGLLRFVDMDGGRPWGDSSGSSYEKLVESTWDMKLWWPHSEILYLYLKLYDVTGDKEFMSLYERAHDYTFSVFPSRHNGEWDQIRDREGRAEEKVIALPVKDPFHILRDFIKIVRLGEKNDN